MKSTELRQLIRESINEYIREIDDAGNKAALEAKMTATQEAIDLREKKIKMDDLDEAYHDMLDKSKVKELGGEVKALKKSLDKLKKQLDKLNSKSTKTEKPEEKEEIVDEAFPERGPRLEEDDLSGIEDDITASTGIDEMDIHEMLHMQKLAGIISETEYITKVEEAKKKASAGMTKKEKSAVVTKARAGKDIGKKGKGFEKVAKAAGGGEKGEKIAAAAMWKSQAKK